MGTDASAKAVWASIVSNVIFGFSFLFSRLALSSATPATLLSVRFLLALLLMSAALMTGKAKVSFRGKPLGGLLLMGLFEPILYFVCETYGILHSTATFSGVMIALIPIAALAFAALFLGERPTLGQVLFSVLSVAGVVWLALSQTGEGSVEPLGVLLLVGAILSAVGYNIVGRRISRSFTPFERTYAVFAMAAVFFTIQALVENGGSVAELVRPLSDRTFLLSIAYLGGMSSVGAFLLVNYSLTHLPISRSSAFANLTTVVSVLAGVVFLHEPMTLAGGLASAMIVLGVWSVQKMALRKVGVRGILWQKNGGCALSENFDRREGGGSPEETVEVTAVKFPKIDPSDLPAEEGMPDIPLTDDPVGDGMKDIPLLEEDRPLNKGWLYNFVLKWDDVQFRRAQTIFGLVIGALAAVALFAPIGRGGEGNTSMWSMVVALVLVMPLPRYIERKIEKRMPQAQKVMMITLLALLILYAVYAFLIHRGG